MAVMTEIRPAQYGKLLAKTLPKVIETDEELQHFADLMESLDRRYDSLNAEERALLALLERLIQDYDDKFELPDVPPHVMIRYLMEHRCLQQSDLVEVLGSRSQVSLLVNGKRGVSKAQAKKLAEFFHVSAELFI